MYHLLKKLTLSVLLVFGLILLVTACTAQETTEDTLIVPPDTSDPLMGCQMEMIRSDLHLNSTVNPTVFVFTDITAFDDFAEENLAPHGYEERLKTEYNITFFKSHGVAVLYMKTASNNQCPYLAAASIDEDAGTVSLTMGRYAAEPPSGDRAGFWIFINFPKTSGYYRTMTGSVTYLPLTMIDPDTFNAIFPPEIPDPDAEWKNKVGAIRDSDLSLNYVFSEAFKEGVEVKDGALGIIVYLDKKYENREQFEAFMKEHGIEGDIFISQYTEWRNFHTYVNNAEELKQIALIPDVVYIDFNYLAVNE